MKVLKPFAPGDLRVVDAPEPEPGEGWVKIAVRASGICGSDKWYWRSGPTDVVAGHEVAGEVTALGPGVRHLAEGDRVAVNNAVGCGHCAECRARRFVRCMRRPGRDVDNGFSEFLIAPERNCLVLDDAVDYVAGSLVLDNWGTPYAALNWASVREGDDVVVTGCGPIGLGSVGIAKLSGAYVIAPARRRRPHGGGRRARAGRRRRGRDPRTHLGRGRQRRRGVLVEGRLVRDGARRPANARAAGRGRY